MTRRWVVNASPLILLGKVEQTALLVKLCDELIIPHAVSVEVGAGSGGREVLHHLADQPTVRFSEAPRLPSAIEGWDLGAGESQVLAEAISRRDSRAVLDDQQARRCAQALGVGVVGTIGVIARARRLNLISAARPLLDELRGVGLYARDKLIERVLTHLGE